MPKSGVATAHHYPRPQLRRAHWISLNGPWDFAIDYHGEWLQPGADAWTSRIEVPFAPETPASGINDNDLYRVCWYRRTFRVPSFAPGDHLMLHFGAVDYRAQVWVNGSLACTHEGGYTPFTADITPLVKPESDVVVVVRAEDDPNDLAKPRGKQDWKRHPHSIWYPRSTGIWQTVWIERVPRTWLRRLRWRPNLERWEIGLAAWFDGEGREALYLETRLRVGDEMLADDRYLVVNGEVHRRIALSDPGIDDYRNELLWSPSSPTLIEAELRLVTATGEVIDEVQSYTALRSIGIEGDRFILNGRPFTLRLVLDQGYWPDTGMTAPDDGALRRDVELAKAMGFNGVRKHQKIEDPRYLYWADRLGLLIWEEMPSAYRFTQDCVQRLTREWMAAVMRDASHPCIVAWVPINESWGVPNLPLDPTERHYVHALYHLTKTFDPTRPVVGNDGWESVMTDIVGIHDYDADPERIARRYHANEVLPQIFKRERPGGRALVLGGEHHADLPVMLTEFGGITLARDMDHTWGYSRATSTADFAKRYSRLLAAVHSLGLFSGFCYTQFTDTYQEANGLLYADRTPKIPLGVIFRATTGELGPEEVPDQSPDEHVESER